jgi:hypothetical protein
MRLPKQRFKEPIPILMEENPSRKAAFLLSLKVAIGFAPTSLVQCMRPPLAAFFAASGYVVAALAAWVFTRVLILIAGLTGHLVRDVSKD